MRELALAAVLVCASGFALPRGLTQEPHPAAAASGANLKPEIAALAEFAGAWACKGVFPSNGQSIESRITFAPDLEGAWLFVRHDDLPPNRFHAYEVWGYDSAAKQYSAFIFDNFGGARAFTSPGWSADALIWTIKPADSSSAPGQRFVFKREKPAGQFVVNYEVKRGADWKIGDTLTCTRQSADKPSQKR